MPSEYQEDKRYNANGGSSVTELLSVILDTIIGDPRSQYHPVVLIGKMISFFESLFYREDDDDKKKLIMGGILAVLVLLVTYDVAMGIDRLAALAGNKWLSICVDAFFLSFMISPRSLAAAGNEIAGLLFSGDIVEARRKTGWIVGRDTDELSESETSRATIETIAENTTDGIISPLFFFAIGGLPLAALYRAANTMDSMLGYKNAKYLYFGRIPAHIDDVLNYIPARITGLLFVISAYFIHLDGKNALRIMKRDASKHPSPNGGYAEAPAAGALHIRLGGYNSYFGKLTFREYMGDPDEQISSRHITSVIRLMYTATMLFIATLLILEHVMKI